MIGPKVLFLLHLVGFAAYLGAAFAQLQFVKRSRGASGDVRAEYERLAAGTITKLELPAILAQVITGGIQLAMTPEWMKQPWMHVKLTCVFLLLVLSHLEMFNARAIVRMREDKESEDAIDARKKRHGLFGAIGTVLVVLVVGAVSWGLR